MIDVDSHASSCVQKYAAFLKEMILLIPSTTLVSFRLHVTEMLHLLRVNLATSLAALIAMHCTIQVRGFSGLCLHARGSYDPSCDPSCDPCNHLQPLSYPILCDIKAPTPLAMDHSTHSFDYKFSTQNIHTHTKGSTHHTKDQQTGHSSSPSLFLYSLGLKSMTPSVPPETETEKTKSLKDKYPEIYAQTNIDRRGCKRIVPMEILSLGMGRTGTMCKFIAFCFIFFDIFVRGGVFWCVRGGEETGWW
jgi:hypothetical protein